MVDGRAKTHGCPMDARTHLYHMHKAQAELNTAFVQDEDGHAALVIAALSRSQRAIIKAITKLRDGRKKALPTIDPDHISQFLPLWTCSILSALLT